MARILIVDDNENIRETMSEILAVHGYEVTAAADGNEALAILRHGSVDLIITDLLMPGKGGIDTIKEARELCPGTKIFAISGGWIGPKEVFLDAARAAGADQTFEKPLDWAGLERAVVEALG